VREAHAQDGLEHRVHEHRGIETALDADVEHVGRDGRKRQIGAVAEVIHDEGASVARGDRCASERAQGPGRPGAEPEREVRLGVARYAPKRRSSDDASASEQPVIPTRTSPAMS